MRNMIILASLALASIAGGEQISTLHYSMPDSGVAPSFAEVTYISRMRQRHGGSDMSMQRFDVTLPLSDPRKSRWNNFYINAELDINFTNFNTGGSLHLDHESMYNLAAPVSLIYTRPNGNRLIFGVAPEIATDGDAIAKGMDLAAFAMYTIKHSKNFKYTLGAALSPRFAVNGLVPFFGFEWKPNTQWTVQMKGYKMAALYHVNNKLSVGPFMAGEGGIWAVDTARGEELFRIRSLVMGVTAEYDFSAPGETKRIMTFSIGSNVATHAEFLKRNADKDTVESHHYKPAFYISGGVDFRF